MIRQRVEKVQAELAAGEAFLVTSVTNRFYYTGFETSDGAVFIAPEGAVYADRDFLWRFSSAGVELEHSDFTALPDYVRLISVLDGQLELKILSIMNRDILRISDLQANRS